MLNFVIELFGRLINWRTSTVGAGAGALILAQWFGYIDIPQVAGIVALVEALALIGAKDK